MKEIETGNNVTSKTPEEIKKGLRRCENGADCDDCIGAYHCRVEADALAYIEQLERERDAAVEDLRSVIIDIDEGCILCAHYHECKGEACPHFESGVVSMDMGGTQVHDFEWTCQLWEHGTCAEMENTPCNGCDFQNHWEWRGVKEE